MILIAAFYLFAIQQGEEYSRFTLVMTGIIYAVITYVCRMFWKKYILNRGEGGK